MSDRFQGRDDALATLRQSLVPGRCLTVMGTAGIGKTRLVAEALGDRAAWADPVRPPSRAPAEIVVLDGPQSARGAVADAIQEWTAAGAAVVATHRDVLGLPGESVLALPPLRLPDEAGGLLATRLAEAGAPPIDPDHAEALVRASRGMPLALELAAARCADLGAETVVRDLTSRLDRLERRGARMVRQTVIREVVDWALEALGAAARPLLHRAAEGAARLADDERDLLTARGLLRAHPVTGRWELPPLVLERLPVGA